MSLNWKEIDLLIENLTINGAHIQQISQFEYMSIVLHLYTAGKSLSLLLSTRRDFVRIAYTSKKPDKEYSKQRFSQILKSRIRNGRIRAVDQIHKQRIVRFSIQKADELLYLYFKMWNNGSNILLVDENHIVLDSLYRRPNSNEVSGARYNPEQSFADSKINQDYSVRPYPDSATFIEYISDNFLEDEITGLVQRKKQNLIKRFQDTINFTERSLNKKNSSLEESHEQLRYEQFGDLLLSNIHRITKNDTSISVEDYFNDNEQVIIELDPEKTPTENAQKYYKKAKKTKQRKKYVKDDILLLQNSLKHLKKGIDRVSDAETLQVLNKIETEYFGSEKTGSVIALDYGLHFLSNGFDIYVGRNSRENDGLLRKKVKGNDWWLHTRDVPGGYVFIKHIKGKSVPLEVLLDAGHLAVFFSKAKGSPVVNLYYTQVKYLRRAKGAKQGTVIPFQEKNITIQHDAHRLERLLNQEK